MARSKPKIIVDIEYTLVRFIVGILRVVPMAVATWLSDKLIRFVLIFIPRRRALMVSNIAQAFPDLPPQQHRKIAKASIQNLARGVTVLVHMPRMFRENDVDWIHVDGTAHLQEAYGRGKGIVTFTGHYGCWEMMAAHAMFKHPRMAAVYRALDNPRIDAMVKEIRSSSGGHMIERHNVLRESLKWLKQNGCIGFLVDQNFADGVFVDFFGRPAATTSALSVLARRTGATILYTRNRWEGNRLRITWGKVPALSQNPNLQEAIAEDTAVMTKIVEGWIREDPGQWMWLHNRWKKQPVPGERVFKAASGNQ